MNIPNCSPYVRQFPNTVELCISKEDKNTDIERIHLLALTELCWNLYSHRLRDDDSDAFFKAGELEYKLSNSTIIDKIIEVDIPWTIGLSLTGDKSLHYTFRFRENMDLFIATHLYLDEDNHTYIEFFKGDDLKISGHYRLDAGLKLFKEHFNEKERFNEIKGGDYVFNKFEEGNTKSLLSDTFKLDTLINCD